MSNKPKDGRGRATGDRRDGPDTQTPVSPIPPTAPPGWSRDDDGRWIPPPQVVVPVKVVHVAPRDRRNRYGGVLLLAAAAVLIGAYTLSSSPRRLPVEVAVRSRSEVRDTAAGAVTSSTAATTTNVAAPSTADPASATSPTDVAPASSNPFIFRSLHTSTTAAKGKKSKAKAAVFKSLLFNPFAALFASAVPKPAVTNPPSKGTAASASPPAKSTPATTTPPTRGTPTTAPAPPPTTTAPTTTVPPPTTTAPTTTVPPPTTTEPATTLPPPATTDPVTPAP